MHRRSASRTRKQVFLSYLVLRVSDEFLGNKTAWEDSKPTATECGLYFCANAFYSKVENGNLEERQLGQWETGVHSRGKCSGRTLVNGNSWGNTRHSILLVITLLIWL